jgi:hypothetical protein
MSRSGKDTRPLLTEEMLKAHVQPIEATGLRAVSAYPPLAWIAKLGWEELLTDNAQMWRPAKWVGTPSAGVAAWLYDGRLLIGGSHIETVIHENEICEKTVPHLWLVDWQKGQRKIINLPIELIIFFFSAPTSSFSRRRV